MTVKVRYSYSIVTPESAADGDHAEHGWLFQGSHYPVDDREAAEHESMRARDAVKDIRDTIGAFESVQAYSREDGMHVTIYGESFDSYCSADNESRAAHLICHPRIAAPLFRALADACYSRYVARELERLATEAAAARLQRL